MHKLSITSSGVIASITEDLDEVNITDLLNFNEADIESLLRTHAGTQAYWEALAIRYKKRYEVFRDVDYRKWWSFHRTYAKLVLRAYGDLKPTVEAIKDQTILIFSEDTTKLERVKYAALAYTVISRKQSVGSEQEFYKLMFKYQSFEVIWYFESMERTLAQLKEDRDLVESVAEKLNSRSFHMRDLLQLLTAKNYNIGPKSISDKDVAYQVKGGINNG